MSEGYFSHPLALVESGAVGRGTRIWAWAHVMQGARIGAHCNIGEHCFIEAGAVLGDRVTVKNGVAVWDGTTVEDDVFLGPGVVLTNDLRPRSRAPGFRPQPTLLCRGCSLGAGTTVLCNLTVGRHALVGAGSLVTRDVPAHALVYGRPARLRGHVCACAATLEFENERAVCVCGSRFERREDRVLPAT